MKYQIGKYLLFIFFIIVSCSDTEQKKVKEKQMPEKDSLSIVRFFDTITLSQNSDKLIDDISQNYKEGKPRHFFNVYKFRYWLQKGKLNEVDSVINTILLDKDFNKNSIEAARYYNILGIVDAYKANQEKSVENFKKAVVIFEENKDYGGAATIYLNVSNIFLSRLDYQAAYDYALKAADNYSLKKDTLYLGTSLAIAAVSAINMEDEQQADSLATLALQMTQKQNNPLGKSLSGYALGEIELHNKNYDKAVDYFQESAQLAQKVNHIQTEIASLTSLSRIYLEREQYQKVISLGTSTIQKAELINNKDILYSLNLYVSQAYANSGKKEEAYNYLKKSNDYFKEKAISDNAKALQELLVQYETEKKEKQIAKQKLEINKQREKLLVTVLGGTILVLFLGGIYFYNRRTHQLKIKQLHQEQENALLNSFIQGEERERNRISHELHDSVASMVGVAKINMEALPHLSEEKQKEQIKKITEILENTHSEIRHIAHNLLPLTLQKEGLVKATEQFANEINETGILKIKVNDNLNEKLTLSIQKQLMLFRIIQELVNNIIKHSQAHNAIITFVEQDKNLIVEITDDGIGFNGEITTESQGLHSIQQRISSVFGKFTFTKNEKNGMTAILRLALLS